MAKPQKVEIKPYFYSRGSRTSVHVSDTDYFEARDVLWSVKGTMYMVMDTWAASKNERLISVAGKYFKNEYAGGRLEELIPVRRLGAADVRRYDAQLKAALEKKAGAP